MSENFWRSLRSREFEVSRSDSVGGSIPRSLHKKPRWCKVVRRVESLCFVWVAGFHLQNRAWQYIRQKLLLGGDHRQRKFPSNTFSSFQNYYEITPWIPRKANFHTEILNFKMFSQHGDWYGQPIQMSTHRHTYRSGTQRIPASIVRPRLVLQFVVHFAVHRSVKSSHSFSDTTRGFPLVTAQPLFSTRYCVCFFSS